MKTIIFSLKYSPGLFKEFILLYDKFKEHGSSPHLVLSSLYKSSFEDSENDASRYSYEFLTKSKNFGGVIRDVILFPILIFKLKSLFRTRKEEPALAFFYNSHPINVLIQCYLRIFRSEIKIATVLHEPHVPKSERKHFGLLRSLYILLILWIQKQSIRLSHNIITVSPNGGNLFLNHYQSYREKLIQSSILFRNPQLSYSRDKTTTISMVGTMNKNKGLGDFILLINYVIKNNLSGLNFKIISSSNLNEYLSNLEKGWEDYLEVISKSYITDKEIDGVICESKIVAVLHTTASQSGVLPLSTKHGTPVLCRNISAFNQFVRHSDMLLSENFSCEEFYNKIKVILNDWDTYNGKTEKIFDQFFSEDNFNEYYSKLIKKTHV